MKTVHHYIIKPIPPPSSVKQKNIFSKNMWESLNVHHIWKKKYEKKTKQIAEKIQCTTIVQLLFEI